MTGVDLVALLEREAATDAATDRERALVDGELLRELDAIADKAMCAYDRVITGEAKTGTSALLQIRNMARDAARWGRARQERAS